MRIFASDFDNTLHFVNEEGKGYFKKEDLEAVEKFQKEGNLFGLCTGRPLYGLQEDLKGGPKLDFIIASTGALITVPEAEGYRTLAQDALSLKDTEGVYHHCSERNGTLFIHADGNIYTVKTFAEHGYPNQKVIESFEALKSTSITGISVWTPAFDTAAILTKSINEKFGITLAAYQNGNWIDVVGLGVSKGNAALHAKELFGADTVAGMGDNFNDIPLLDRVDISFTFHSSAEEVQSHATYVVDSIAEAMQILNTKK
mgnify:CR=1 FL=1